MNKRLAKRHKRQVARGRERGKLSEPELRTPEQVTAAREASRAVSRDRNDRRPIYATPAPNRAGPGTSGPILADVGPWFALLSGCSPQRARIADPSILEAQKLEMAWSGLFGGSSDLSGALFVGITFSCSDGRCTSRARP